MGLFEDDNIKGNVKGCSGDFDVDIDDFYVGKFGFCCKFEVGMVFFVFCSFIGFCLC